MSIDPITETFYDQNGLPLPGLNPTFAGTYGYWKTLANVPAVAPTPITDGGDGDYDFTPSATDLITGIKYLLDGGATAVPRFITGTIQSAASAQPGTTVAVTGVNIFGVTPDLVKKRHFPQWNAFTTNSNPSLATVLELIDECAGELEGRLAQESITATAITVSNSGAYLWCRRVLRLMAAIEVLSVATQQAPPLSARWQKQLDQLWEDLSTKGYLALGSGVSAPTSPADGPTTHIDVLGIDVGDMAGDASAAIPRLRRDDQL